MTDKIIIDVLIVQNLLNKAIKVVGFLLCKCYGFNGVIIVY